MKTLVACAVLILGGYSEILNAQPISYSISWEKPNTHYFNVEMIIQHDGGDLDIRIPAWRPGRYHMQDFAKNILSVRATDSDGHGIRPRKVDSNTWRVDRAEAGRLTIEYSSYSRALDAGSSYLDDVQAWINPITLLMYVPGRELESVRLSVQQPEGWEFATALEQDPDGSFPSPNYHELVDSPILVSPRFEKLTFEEGGAVYEIVLQGRAEGTLPGDSLVSDVRRIVAAQSAIMQDVPFDRYVVLVNMVPFRFGHGVEHKNSTCIVIGPADWSSPQFYNGLFSTISHEFFHVWNVERIRPEVLYYPDYSKPNHTSTMWIYEGFTSYYSGLSKVRGGFTRPENYIRGLGRLFEGYDRIPGRRVTTPAMTSWDSWVKQREAPPNTYYSFYSVGQVLGVLLDLEIRGTTENQKSLDDVMRYLYREHHMKDRGVPEAGLENAIKVVTGHNVQDFFDRYVYGTDSVEYNRYLQHAGLELIRVAVPERPAARLGVGVGGDDKEVRIVNIEPDSPAQNAGLFLDDILLAIDGRRVLTTNLSSLLKRHQPGDTVDVALFRRSEMQQIPVVLSGGGNITYQIYVKSETTPLQDQIRQHWLRRTGAKR